MKKKIEIQEMKARMLSKMNQSELKGGLVAKETIAGCCTQGCCDGGLKPIDPIIYPIDPVYPIYPIGPFNPRFGG